MTDQNPTSFLQQVLQTNDQPEVVFSELLPKLGEWLECDRCFLYVRHPSTKMGKVTDCWRRSSQFPDLKTTVWQQEPASLPQADPLFAAALQAKPSIFVEDVETADPEIVNREFEQANFGHRALIHAHLVQAGNLWGVLQPCVFGQPRIWSKTDRKIILELEQLMTPFVISYVKKHF
ncbi:MAG: GAF domain-containing protein [Aphanocapsa sp. GSE-SYN-MK-11-07L]|jgi:GAF domain-containing protein|nr:GAF domain-containing protein [Aphanocapsa sp. GSE-SYN-MK-11-07L]